MYKAVFHATVLQCTRRQRGRTGAAAAGRIRHRPPPSRRAAGRKTSHLGHTRLRGVERSCPPRRRRSIAGGVCHPGSSRLPTCGTERDGYLWQTTTTATAITTTTTTPPPHRHLWGEARGTVTCEDAFASAKTSSATLVRRCRPQPLRPGLGPAAVRTAVLKLHTGQRLLVAMAEHTAVVHRVGPVAPRGVGLAVLPPRLCCHRRDGGLAVAAAGRAAARSGGGRTVNAVCGLMQCARGVLQTRRDCIVRSKGAIAATKDLNTNNNRHRHQSNHRQQPPPTTSRITSLVGWRQRRRRRARRNRSFHRRPQQQPSHPG